MRRPAGRRPGRHRAPRAPPAGAGRWRGKPRGAGEATGARHTGGTAADDGEGLASPSSQGGGVGMAETFIHGKFMWLFGGHVRVCKNWVR